MDVRITAALIGAIGGVAGTLVAVFAPPVLSSMNPSKDLVGLYECRGACQNEFKDASIEIIDGILILTNEVNEKSEATFDSSSRSVYAQKWKLTGHVSEDGTLIGWENPTVWIRLRKRR